MTMQRSLEAFLSVVAQALSPYLTLKELSTLDVALTNVTLRQVYLGGLSSTNASWIYNAQKGYVTLNGMGSAHSTVFLQWLNTRKVRVERLMCHDKRHARVASDALYCHRRYLRELELEYGLYTSDQIIKWVKEAPQLERLSLHLDYKAGLAVCPALREYCPKLKELVLRGWIDKWLFEALSVHLRHLQSFVFCTQIFGIEHETFKAFLQSCTDIRSLAFRACRMFCRELNCIADNCPKLESLELHDSVKFPTLTNIMMKCPLLRKLHLRHLRTLSDSSWLDTLATACPLVEELYLEDCLIPSDCFMEDRNDGSRRSFCHLKHLQKLKLVDYVFYNQAVPLRDNVQCMGDMFRMCNQLTHLSMILRPFSSCRILVRFPEKLCPNLKCLSLGYSSNEPGDMLAYPSSSKDDTKFININRMTLRELAVREMPSGLGCMSALEVLRVRSLGPSLSDLGELCPRLREIEFDVLDSAYREPNIFLGALKRISRLQIVSHARGGSSSERDGHKHVWVQELFDDVRAHLPHISFRSLLTARQSSGLPVAADSALVSRALITARANLSRLPGRLFTLATE
jgi:hypothetical protein